MSYLGILQSRAQTAPGKMFGLYRGPLKSAYLDKYGAVQGVRGKH